MTGTDLELLTQYRQEQAEAAFAEIVRRHLPLVYSAALRVVRSPALAEEVAQTTFTTLARQACQLAPGTILTAWLYRVARHEAVDVVRREARRQLREQVFTEMNATHSAEGWNRIEPLLEEAMHALDEIDRTAILLRYFENKSLREVGAAMGTSDDAAQKRVSRAIGKLCEFFGENGVTVGASGLAVMISAQAVQAAPLGLALTISTTALLAASSLMVGATATATQVLVMTAVQKALVIGCVALLTGAVVYTTNRPKPDPTKLAAVATTTNANPVAKGTNQNGFFAQPKARAGSDLPPHLAKAIAQLRAALKREGTVHDAILAFGVDRKEAFPILKEAASSPDMEVRKRAIQGMSDVGRPATPSWGLYGDPALEAKSYLWAVVKDNNNAEMAMYAYVALSNTQLNSEDLPQLVQLMTATQVPNLKANLPANIAQMIERDTIGAAPYLPEIKNLLQDPNVEIQNAAAAVLAKTEAAHNPDILPILTAGLKGDAIQQSISLRGLQSLGTLAKPSTKALLEMADSAFDRLSRESAIKTAGIVDPDLRNSVPEVDQFFKKADSGANWNNKFASGNYSYPDLLAALKEQQSISFVADKLGTMGAAAKEAVPALISALSGRYMGERMEIEKAIQLIDPTTTIAKVDVMAVANGASDAVDSLRTIPKEQQPKRLIQQLSSPFAMGTSWLTQQEVVEMANQIKAKDVGAYRAFVDRLAKEDPSTSVLFDTAKVQ